MKNLLKQTMKERPVFGMTIYSGSPAVVEILGNLGFDFAFIDMEHAPLQMDGLREIILAARMAGISPLVRVSCPDEIQIRKVLELGAEGVIIPHVRTKEEAETCVRGAKFPPVGRRGYDSSVRSAVYGSGDYVAGDYINYSNNTELVIPMAEDYEFIDNIEDIFAVDGIDAINFGPADYALSKNIRVFYDMNQPDVQQALDQVVCHAKEKHMAVMAPAVPPVPEKVYALIQRGVNMIICGNDFLCLQLIANGIKKDVLEKYKHIDNQ